MFTYLDAFATDEHFQRYLPDYENLDQMKEHYRRGGLGDVKCKKFLEKVLNEELDPIRERRARWEADIPGVYEILREGTERARKKTQETLEEVRAAMKINYFDNSALISEWMERHPAGKA